MYYVPNEGELCPEWRIMLIVAFPGENNYYRVEISLEDKERIEKSTDWVIVDHHHFNLKMCECFRFDTEIKDGMSWVSYTKERADKILKEELEAEMQKQLPQGIATHNLLAGMFDNSSDAVVTKSSIADMLQQIMSEKNGKKTGKI